MSLIRLLLATCYVIVFGGCLFDSGGYSKTESENSAHEQELSKLDDRIAAVAGDLEESNDIDQKKRFAVLALRRATLTELDEDLAVAYAAVEETRVSSKCSDPDVLWMMAQCAVHQHKFQLAEKILARARWQEASPALIVMRGDLHLHAGKLAEAREKYQSALELERSWYTLARLAHLEYVAGNDVLADEIYGQSQEEMTAKEMRSFAWVEIQRGNLDLKAQQFKLAREHYQRADAAYSGYWLVRRQTAEVLAAEGQYDAAIDRYHELVADHPRPDHCERLGELLAAVGKHNESQEYYDLAVKGFLKSVESNDGRYLHHLAHFYTEVCRDIPLAVIWSQRDLQQRPGPATRAAYAWALYLDGQFESAAEHIDQAMSQRQAVDEFSLERAAKIVEAAGNDALAKSYRAKHTRISKLQLIGIVCIFTVRTTITTELGVAH